MAGKQTMKTSIDFSICQRDKQSGYVRVLDPSTGSHIVAVNINGKIHIYCGSVRQVIVRCPRAARAFELQRNQDKQWQIWLATQGGSIYRSSLNLDSSATSEPVEVDANDGNNQSIFEDLLNTSEPAFTENNIPHNLADDIHEVGEKDQVLSDCGDVLGICCTKEIFALVSADKDGSTVSIYSLSQLTSMENGSFAQKLPLPSSQKKQSHQFLQTLHVVLCDVDDQGVSSSQITIPSHLFSSLFGWESSVRSLPVLVCAFTDGSVFYHPADLTASRIESPWLLLCAVDSSVVDILPTKINRTLSEKESVAAELKKALGMNQSAPCLSLLDAIIVVGNSGKCCLMTAMPALTSQPQGYKRLVTMFTLPSSVECVSCRDGGLFVSCGQNILKCSLTLIREEREERRHHRVEVQSDQLICASVNAMWSSGKGETLVCITANKDFIEVDTSTPTDIITRPLQTSLKDLLLGVDIHQTRLNQLKAQQEQCNSTLQQINLASLLLHASGMQPTCQVPPPISCEVTVQSDVNYHAVEFTIVIQATNRCGVALSKDWSLVASLCAVDSNSAAPEAELRQASSSSHILTLSRGLEAGRSVDMKIPIAYSRTCCGVIVNVSLTLHIPEALRDETEKIGKGLDIPLSQTVVDVVHFLFLKQPGQFLPRYDDPVTFLEKQMREMRHLHNKEVEQKQIGQIYSVSLKFTVSADNCLSTPAKVLGTLLKGSQVDMNQLTHPSCSLQTPCWSVLTLSVEQATQTTGSGTKDDKSFTISAKSSDVSLLARARLAMTRRLQHVGAIYRDVPVEEFQKIIRKTETLQQQLQGLQDKQSREDKSPSNVQVQLCAIYEAVQSESL